jgi:hypothetical protein
VKVRPFRKEDEPVLRAMYEQMGFDYVLPELEGRDFVSVWVAVDETDAPVMALAARKTVEMFMLADQRWKTPGWRMEAFSELHFACHQDVLRQGFTDAHCWLPPQVVKSFGRRLKRYFGWVESKWKCFAKEL